MVNTQVKKDERSSSVHSHNSLLSWLGRQNSSNENPHQVPNGHINNDTDYNKEEQPHTETHINVRECKSNYNNLYSLHSLIIIS